MTILIQVAESKEAYCSKTVLHSSFLFKLTLKKISRQQQKHEKLPSMQRVTCKRNAGAFEFYGFISCVSSELVIEHLLLHQCLSGVVVLFYKYNVFL